MNKDFLDKRNLLGVLHLERPIFARLSNRLTFISVHVCPLGYPRLDFWVPERFAPKFIVKVFSYSQYSIRMMNVKKEKFAITENHVPASLAQKTLPKHIDSGANLWRRRYGFYGLGLS